jgi:DNA-binding MarR family transcriptional regulator
MDPVDDILAQWRRERPDLDVTPMGLIGRLNRLARQLSREMEATFRAHGLNGASFDVLATLRRSGPPYALSPGRLMATMMITSGTMTNRIDQLEKAGLVTRSANPDDARSFIVGLTEQGFTVIDAAVTDHAVTQARLVARLPEADRAALDRLLRRYLLTFAASPDDPPTA